MFGDRCWGSVGRQVMGYGVELVEMCWGSIGRDVFGVVLVDRCCGSVSG